MEQIQERALRFVTDDFTSSLTGVLNKTHSELVHVKRIKLIASEAYTILNNKSPSCLQPLITLKESSYNSRRERQAVVPKVNTTIGTV
jgi:hypothetical protein